MTDTKQPEALRLADESDNDEWIAGTNQWREEAAAELRRLHEVNQELVKILEDFRDAWDCDEDAHRYDTQCRCCAAKAALIKATGRIK